MNSTAIFLDSADLFLMMMVRRFLSVVVVSLLLLYVALFSLSSHNVHLHGGLVLDDLGGGEGGASSELLRLVPKLHFVELVLEHFHGDLLGLGACVLGGGEGGSFQRSAFYGGLLVNFILDASFTSLHFRVHN
jgi:hypothetical protein